MRLRYAKISDHRIREVLRCFCEDLTANTAAKIQRLNVNTAERYYSILREKIVRASLLEAHFSGEVEIDESYFGARRVRDKRGRGAAGKTPVFGILKRGGKVYVTVVKNCSRKQFMPIIQGKVLEGSTVYSDGGRPMTVSCSTAMTTTAPSTVSMNLHERRTTSTASKPSGALPRDGSRSSIASLRTSFTST